MFRLSALRLENHLPPNIAFDRIWKTGLSCLKWISLWRYRSVVPARRLCAYTTQVRHDHLPSVRRPARLAEDKSIIQAVSNVVLGFNVGPPNTTL
jgi:hypothetical protein